MLLLERLIVFILNRLIDKLRNYLILTFFVSFLFHVSSVVASVGTVGTLKWSYAFNYEISSAAIGSDGTIYVGSYDKNIYAINPNGTLKWRYTVGGAITSSPAIGSDGTIYVGSDDGNIYALNSSGTLKWNYMTGSTVYTTPAISSDGTIYVGDSANIRAINPDGTLKWNFITLVDNRSSPAIGSDGTIYVGSFDNNIYAINPNGTLKWRYMTGSTVYSSPAIGSDGTIYVGSYDNKIYALKSDGTLKWSYLTGGGIHSSPAIGSDGTVYVGSYDKKIYAINHNGTLKWSLTTDGYIASSPSIGSDGTIYVGSSKVLAINSNGTLKWAYYTGDSVHSSPVIGSDGTIYVGMRDSNLNLKLFAFYGSGSLAHTPWPMFHHDLQHTGKGFGVVIDDGASYTNNTTVKLYLSASSDTTQMCISNTPSCYSWITYERLKKWSFANTIGGSQKTVYVLYKNNIRNNNITPYTATISLDTVAPINGSLTAVPGSHLNELRWDNFSDSSSGIAKYELVFSEVSYPTSCTTGTQIYTGPALSYVHTGLNSGITYYYRVCATDKAGNTSTGVTVSAEPQ